jgi:hypothetical protein
MTDLWEAGCQRMLCYKLAALPGTAFYGMNTSTDQELNNAISNKAEEINLKSTKRYLGKEIEVVIVKENNGFQPKMKGKHRSGKKIESFDFALGFLKKDSGVFSPLFYVEDPEKKMRAGQKVRVKATKIMSPRAVRAAPCN